VGGYVGAPHKIRHSLLYGPLELGGQDEIETTGEKIGHGALKTGGFFVESAIRQERRGDDRKSWEVSREPDL